MRLTVIAILAIGIIAILLASGCVSDQHSWAGLWVLKQTYPERPDTQMKLEQVGNTVTGTYDLSFGKVTGTVQGDRLIGIWTEADCEDPTLVSTGPFEYILAGDGKTFSGWWDFEGSDFEKIKQDPVSRFGNRVSGPYTWTGSWMVSPGASHGPFTVPMTLEQKDNGITGRYAYIDCDVCSPDEPFSCTIDIEGTVQDDGRMSGRAIHCIEGAVVLEENIELVMTNDGMGFYGWWDNTGDAIPWEDAKACWQGVSGERLSW